jgi:hypothetical protein
MKKILGITAVLFALGISVPSFAQETTKKEERSVKKTARKAAKAVKKGAKSAGNKTAELATKGKAKVTDKKSDTWVGPNGQDIYVDDGNKYYWINERGGREFVTADQLKRKG